MKGGTDYQPVPHTFRGGAQVKHQMSEVVVALLHHKKMRDVGSERLSWLVSQSDKLKRSLLITPSRLVLHRDCQGRALVIVLVTFRNLVVGVHKRGHAVGAQVRQVHIGEGDAADAILIENAIGRLDILTESPIGELQAQLHSDGDTAKSGSAVRVLLIAKHDLEVVGIPSAQTPRGAGEDIGHDQVRWALGTNTGASYHHYP